MEGIVVKCNLPNNLLQEMTRISQWFDKLLSRGRKTRSFEYEIIKGSSLFDAVWYLKHYHDVKDAKLDPLEHYLKSGWKEGRNPSRKFHNNFYLRNNPDVAEANICPLYHYLTYGWKEGRMISRVNSRRYKSSSRSEILTFVSRSIYRYVYRRQIKKAQSVRIAVHLHLFYEELWDDVKGYLKNLSCYHYDLFITYPSAPSEKVLKDIHTFKPDAQLFKIPNRGFNLGAFIYFLHQIKLNDYDVIFKLHTKRDVVASNYYGLYMKSDEWRRFLYGGILGERTVHRTMIDLLTQPKVGMVAHADLITSIDLKYNEDATIKTMEQFNLALPESYQFVMGTVFAAKPSLFQNIRDSVSMEDFPLSRRGHFTLAHCFERILCLNVLSQGFEIKGERTFYWKKSLRRWQAHRNPYNPQRLLNKELVKNYVFFEKTNPQERRHVQICSLLAEKNSHLFDALVRKATIDFNNDQPVDDSSFQYLALLEKVIINHELARMASPFESTIFRLVGDAVTVEKKIHPQVKKKQRWSMLKVCDQGPKFVLKGTYFLDMISKFILEKDVSQLIDTLTPYLSSVFTTFQTHNSQELRADSWDAIPRNTLIDSSDQYRFFDCNIHLISGVPKPHFIYRVVLDISLYAKIYQYEFEEEVLKNLYDALCRKFNLSGDYQASKDLDRKLKRNLEGSVSFKDKLKYVSFKMTGKKV